LGIRITLDAVASIALDAEAARSQLLTLKDLRI
jgi:hypothetical protein